MYASITNVIFLLIFALAVSSSPVLMLEHTGNADNPGPADDIKFRQEGSQLFGYLTGKLLEANVVRTVTPAAPVSKLRPIANGKYDYEIDGMIHSAQDVLSAMDNWHKVAEGTLTLSYEDLAKAQKLVIESTYLEDFEKPNIVTKLPYKHEFMLVLVGILRSIPGPVHPTVSFLARKRLQNYLDWEVMTGVDGKYPVKPVDNQYGNPETHHRPLYDPGYLQDLYYKLREIVR
ncbi:hypothetical protein H0H93_009581 [Arthromyces matolae]|nr:hypothetical protein H0H93_009581 [Arthromyces matolae]